MISFIINLAVALLSWQYMDIDSGYFVTEFLCPIIFAFSVILLLMRVSSWFGNGGSGGSGGWFGGDGGFGDGGGDCGGDGGGC